MLWFGCCKHAPSLSVSVEVAFLEHWLSWPLIYSVPKWQHIAHASESLGTGFATAEQSYHLVPSLACAYRDCPGRVSSVEQLLSLGLFPIVP